MITEIINAIHDMTTTELYKAHGDYKNDPIVSKLIKKELINRGDY
jgi:hypothetical protein